MGGDGLGGGGLGLGGAFRPGPTGDLSPEGGASAFKCGACSD